MRSRPSLRWLGRKRTTPLLLRGIAGAVLAFALLPPTVALAERMESASYVIQFGNLNITSGEKSSSSYKVTDTVGQTAPGEYGTSGYKVLAGFQYIYGTSRFSFRITNLTVNLGELGIAQFQTGSHDLVISTRSGGYSITARADHQLRIRDASTTIPATSCDTLCTISSAGTWTNSSKYGLGYSVSGTHKSSDFSSSNHFRPFADASLSEAAQTIATHTAPVRNDWVTVTYKVAISGSQAAGTYQTAITYNAVPTY